MLGTADLMSAWSLKIEENGGDGSVTECLETPMMNRDLFPIQTHMLRE